MPDAIKPIRPMMAIGMFATMNSVGVDPAFEYDPLHMTKIEDIIGSKIHQPDILEMR